MPKEKESIFLVQGNDDYKAEDFFDRLLDSFNIEYDKDLAIVTVNHIVRTLPPFLNGLQKMGDVVAVLSKSSYPNNETEEYLKKNSFNVVSAVEATEYRNNSVKAINFLKQITTNYKKIVIIDIGGYFSDTLVAIEQEKELKQKIVGYVEDTQNGYKRYKEKAHQSSSCIISIANTETKDDEDWYVGLGIVNAAEHILRVDAHTMAPRMEKIAVIGYGKIGASIAEHVRKYGAQEVMVIEIDPIRAKRALTRGFKIGTKTDLRRYNMVFAATGSKCLGEDEFEDLKDNVFIASCTSSNDEFMLDYIKKNAKNTIKSATKNTTQYQLHNGKKINFLYDGNAVNFVCGGVNGAPIYAVLGLLLVSAAKLNEGKVKFKTGEVIEPDLEWQKKVAEVYLETYSDSESLINLPPLNEYLVERKQALKQLIDKSSAKKGKISATVIHGYPGMGKSQLVKGYAHELSKKKEYQVIWWLNAGHNQLLGEYRKLAKALNESGLVDNACKIDCECEQITVLEQAIIENFQQIKNWLLIFDNVEEEKNITPWVTQNFRTEGRRSIFITATQRLNIGKSLSLGLFTQEEASSYLKLALKDRISESETINLFLNKIGHYPLVLSIMAGYAANTPEQDLNKFLEKISQDALISLEGKYKEFSSAEIYDYYQKTCTEVTESIITRLQKKDEDLINLLFFISFLSPTNIPKTLLINFLASTGKNTTICETAIQKLMDFNLLSAGSVENTFNIHTLLQNIINKSLKKLVDKSLLAEFENSAVRVLVECLNEEGKENKEIEAIHLLLHSHLVTAVESCVNTSSRNKDYQWLLYHLARSWQAQKEHRKALKLYDSLLNKKYLNTKVKQQLVHVYIPLGQYQQAQKLSNELLSTAKKSNDKNQYFDALFNFIYCLHQIKADDTKVDEMIERAEEFLSENTTAIDKAAEFYKFLAKLYIMRRKIDLAKSYIKEAINNYSGSDGSLFMLSIEYKRAEIAFLSKDFKEAEEKYKLILPQYINLYGLAHAKIRRLIIDIAKIHNTVEKFTAFADELEKNYPNPPATFYITLAQACQQLFNAYKITPEEFEIIKKYYDKALKKKKCLTKEENDKDFTDIYSSLGYYFLKIDIKQAIEYSKKALTIKEMLNGSSDFTVATAHRNLARNYLEANDEKNFFNHINLAQKIEDNLEEEFRQNDRITTLDLLAKGYEKFPQAGYKNVIQCQYTYIKACVAVFESHPFQLVDKYISACYHCICYIELYPNNRELFIKHINECIKAMYDIFENNKGVESSKALSLTILKQKLKDKSIVINKSAQHNQPPLKKIWDKNQSTLFKAPKPKSRVEKRGLETSQYTVKREQKIKKMEVLK